MIQYFKAAAAALMIATAFMAKSPPAFAAGSDIDPTGMHALRLPVPVQKAAIRSRTYKIAGRRSRRRVRRAVGIAVGVAATAIILNEAAKAERRRKKRARARARARRARCHHDQRVHSHRVLGGRVAHRHDRNCVAYVETRENDLAAAPPPASPPADRDAPEPRCDRGYVFYDGKCVDETRFYDDSKPDQRASNDEDLAYERCAAKYRSFRYEDGTYQPYGHRPRKLCPYLE